MSIILSDVYTGRVDTTDPNYPNGKPRNKVGAVDGTGTPYEEKYFQDISGAFQALLVEGGITASGNPDNANVSDIRDAILKMIRKPLVLKVFQSPTDGLTEINTRTLLGGEVYEIRKVSDNSFATIYSDKEGLNPITQDGTSNVSGSDGVVEFYIADGDYYVDVGVVSKSFSVGHASDLSSIYIFNTVEGFKSSKIEFPDGKTIHIKERDSDFIKITGTSTANNFSVIASNEIDQSVEYVPNLGVASVYGLGATAAAANFAQSNYSAIDFGNYEYTTTEKISISNGVAIHSQGAKILKNYDGIGIEFTNQSATVDVFGRLDVIGFGDFAGNGLVESVSPLAHGISIKSSRVRVHGALWSYNHVGDAVNFDSDNHGNSNKSDFNELRGNSSNGYGIRCTGTSDDTSVWRIGFYAQGNFKSGFSTSSDFMGRNWNGLIYSESNCNDTTSTEVDIEKLRESDLVIYAEAGVGSLEVMLGENTSNLEITSLRSNLDSDNSLAQNNRWKRGSLAVNPGVSGGSRVGEVGGFKFGRARGGNGGEGVKVPMKGSDSTFGHFVAVNSQSSPFTPYLGFETENLSSFIRVGDQDFRVNSNGDDFIHKTETDFEIGTTNTAYKTKVNMFGNVAIFVRSSSPEGQQPASTGSICLVNGGGAGTSFYVKESGTGSTGWVGK